MMGDVYCSGCLGPSVVEFNTVGNFGTLIVEADRLGVKDLCMLSYHLESISRPCTTPRDQNRSVNLFELSLEFCDYNQNAQTNRIFNNIALFVMFFYRNESYFVFLQLYNTLANSFNILRDVVKAKFLKPGFLRPWPRPGPMRPRVTILINKSTPFKTEVELIF